MCVRTHILAHSQREGGGRKRERGGGEGGRGWGREGGREGGRDRQTDRQTETETDRDRDKRQRKRGWVYLSDSPSCSNETEAVDQVIPSHSVLTLGQPLLALMTL